MSNNAKEGTSAHHHHIDGVVMPTPRGPPIGDMKQPASPVVNHHRLVNTESSYPDVQFLFEEEKRTLEAHHAFLKVRAPSLIADAKQKKKGWVVTLGPGKGKSKLIPNCPEALYRVLVYLYTGDIDWGTYTAFQAIEVLFLAKAHNLVHLAQLNKKYIQDQISLHNVFDVLRYAHRLDVEEVKVLCVDFALRNPDFFTSPKALDLGFDLYQEATAVLVKHYTKKMTPVVLERKGSSPNTIAEDFQAIYNARNETGDYIFKLVGDKQVKVHKAMLTNLSPELDALLKVNAQAVVPTRPQFVDHQVGYGRLTADAFEAMLRFLYYNERNITLLHATQLYLFAKDFKLSSLVSTLDSVMEATDVDTPSVLFMIQIAFLEMADKKELQQTLKTKGLVYVVNNLDKIDFKSLDFMPPIIGAAVVDAVQQAIKKNASLWENVKANFNKDPKPLPTSATTPSVGALPHISSTHSSAHLTTTTSANLKTTSSANLKTPVKGAPPPPPVEDDAHSEAGDGKPEKRTMRTKKESRKPLQPTEESKKPADEAKETSKDKKKDKKKD